MTHSGQRSAYFLEKHSEICVGNFILFNNEIVLKQPVNPLIAYQSPMIAKSFTSLFAFITVELSTNI